ncbi:type I secretion system permease/ATPase [Rhizobium sp. BK376]|uniref:type I secretion system permease/ATPase n=1 Tax=Rhizobium sp. BK376 TaxID=2512149 RepID=UPI0010D42C08|nr:type I secretion system permease/ATPase [Rhizobium sp. BK376]TCR82245.1 ATP-binding cassette subfamily C protein [Rhizobium sp. BK376]
MNQISKLGIAESQTVRLRSSVAPAIEQSDTNAAPVVTAIDNVIESLQKLVPVESRREAKAADDEPSVLTSTRASFFPLRNEPPSSPARKQVQLDLPKPKAFEPRQLGDLSIEAPSKAAKKLPLPQAVTEGVDEAASKERIAPPQIEVATPKQTILPPEAQAATASAIEPAPAVQTVMRDVSPVTEVKPPEVKPEVEMKAHPGPLPRTIDSEPGPIKDGERRVRSGGGGNNGDDDGKGNGGGGGGGGNVFHKRSSQPLNFAASLRTGMIVIRRNMLIVMAFTLAINVLVLAIPIYLFQISDRVLTSRSIDTLVMLTIAVLGAVILQVVLDAVRRFILMRTAVELEVQLGAPILSAAARASLHGTGRDYQTLSDLQQLRGFITSGTLIAFLDAPLMPLFIVVVFMVHPSLGVIVLTCCAIMFVIAYLNQKMTAQQFAEANSFLGRANFHLDSMARNSQIINALAMIPEAVKMWGRETSGSLKAQVAAQDRNIVFSGLTKACRLVTQVTLLGWGAHLSLAGDLTGGMVIAASIVSGRALAPIEGAIEGWNQFNHSRAAYGRIKQLLLNSPLNFPRLRLPNPEGRLDVERILFVPPPQKKVILNGISFSLSKGESLAVIGNSGSGKTTLGKMLVGSILPTSGNVRLDLMDLRNWDQRQFGESIGYLPQDVQLFPGTIKANICRMRDDVDDQLVYEAAVLADVHELIASFSQGYETVVSADGSPLSGGQKQRIALARAFFGNPKFVVLDEPNSNLDTAGENALARALLHAKKQGITTVTITQRPALLQCVDKILVLKDGSVAMFGERMEVLKAMSTRPSDSINGGQQAPRIGG